MEISLMDGGVVVVDPIDYDWINARRWHLNNSGYPVSSIKIDGHWTYKLMHIVICFPEYLTSTGKRPVNERIDHKDGNKLNNQRSNLRMATAKQNARHRTKARFDSKTGIIGVYWNKKLKRFTSDIYLNGKTKHLGVFDTIEQAKEARIIAENIYYGSFAPLRENKK